MTETKVTVCNRQLKHYVKF